MSSCLELLLGQKSICLPSILALFSFLASAVQKLDGGILWTSRYSLFKYYQTPLSYPVNSNNLSNGKFYYLTIGLEACSLQ